MRKDNKKGIAVCLQELMQRVARLKKKKLLPLPVDIHTLSYCTCVNGLFTACLQKEGWVEPNPGQWVIQSVA